MSNSPLTIGKLTAKIPLIQGGMGIGISLSGLAAAVANAGGIGVISAAQIGFRDPLFETNSFEANKRAIQSELKKARQLAPDGIIGYNIMSAMNHYKEYAIEAAKAGADVIISGAGLPVCLPEYVKEYDTLIAPIVSSAKATSVILKLWSRKYHRTADFIVVEGPKAGGHLGFHKDELVSWLQHPYEEEVTKIQKVVQEYEEQYEIHIPLILAGGIGTKEEVDHAMGLGIDGVQVASRFITTYECDAASTYKEAILNASREDIIIVDSPVGMPGRAIKNEFITRVMAGEKNTPTKCYGCLNHCNPKEIPYCITKALINAAKGKLDQGLIFCGANAYRQNKIESVQEVIDSLMKTCII